MAGSDRWWSLVHENYCHSIATITSRELVRHRHCLNWEWAFGLFKNQIWFIMENLSYDGNLLFQFCKQSLCLYRILHCISLRNTQFTVYGGIFSVPHPLTLNQHRLTAVQYTPPPTTSTRLSPTTHSPDTRQPLCIFGWLLNRPLTLVFLLHLAKLL